MTVKDLINELNFLVEKDKDIEDYRVMLSLDEEGNDYKPLYTVEFGQKDYRENTLVLWP